MTASTAWAASPYQLSYGGRLADASGAPIAGPVELKIKFFDAASGGSQLGEDVDDAEVTLAGGIFQAPIALSGSAFQQIFGSGATVYIEVTDVTHDTTYPRQSFSAVPYALRVPVDQATITYDNNGNLTLTNPNPLPVSGNGAFTAPIGLDVLASDPAGLTAADAGKMWYNGGIKFWNGSSVELLGVSGGGLQSLNGLTNNTQSLEVSVGGTSPSWVDAGSTHTLSLPMAGSAGVNAGLISNTDYASFSAKLGNGGQAGPLKLGSTDATSVTLETNGAGLLFLASSGNVGVGTSAPGQKLSVAGTIESTAGGFKFPDGSTMTSAANTSGAASGSTSGYLSSTDWSTFNSKQSVLSAAGASTSGYLSNADWTTFNDKQSELAAANSITNGYLSDTDWLTFNSKVSSQWAANGSAIYYNGGNVGIGTASPASPLDVRRSSGLGGVLLSMGYTSSTTFGEIDIKNDFNDTFVLGMTGTNFSSSYWTGGPTGEGAYMGTGAFAPLSFGTNAQQRMIISAAGNVGIGTSSPGALLDVEGSLKLGSAGTPGLGKVLTSDGSGNATWQTATSTPVTNNNNQSFDNVAQLSIGTSATSGADLLFGGANRTIAVASQGAAGGNLTIQAGDTTVNGDNGGSLVLASGATNGGTASSQIQLQTSSNGTTTNAMTILGNGDVGIGTTSPVDVLDIRTTGQDAVLRTYAAYDYSASHGGNAVLELQSDVGTADIIFNNSNAANQDAMIRSKDMGTYQGALLFFTKAGTTQSLINPTDEKMRILPNGNVGIGTTSPAGILDVQGGAASTANGRPINLYAESGTGTYGGGNIILMPGSSTDFGVPGQVGIGIATPQDYLSVSPPSTDLSGGFASQSGNTVSGFGAAFWTSNAVGKVLTFANGVSAGTIISLNNNNSIVVSTNQSVSLQAYSVNSIGLNVDGEGDVGIGTYSPGNLLDVAGGVAIGTYAGTSGPSNGLMVSGNVGIGTSTPGTTLEVLTSVSGGGIRTTNSSNLGPSSGGYVSALATGMPTAGDQRVGVYSFGFENGGFPAEVAAVRAYSSQAYTWSSAQGSYLTLNTTPNGSSTVTERMRIDQAGNVGIGSSSPGAMLDVEGSIKLGAAGTPALGKVLTSDANGNATWQTLASGSIVDNNNQDLDDVAQLGIGTTASSGADLLFGAANRTIAVASQGATGGNLTIQAGGTSVNGDNGGNLVLASGATSGGTASSQIQLQTSNNGTTTNAITILGNGNVGIGTTNPLNNLHVHVGVNQNLGTRSNSNGVTSLGAFNDTGIGAVLEVDASVFGVSDSTQNSTGAITADGSSAATIHAMGSSSFVGSFESTNALYAGFDVNATGTGKPFIQLNRGTNRLFTISGETDNNTIAFRGGNAAANAIMAMQDSTGYVGIGTTSPAARLDVAGQVHAQVYAAAANAMSFDWANGNVQYSSQASAGGGTVSVTLANTLDGGAYTLFMQNTQGATYTFVQSTLTFKFLSTNGPTTSGKDTIYTFVRAGTTVYVSWTTGI